MPPRALVKPAGRHTILAEPPWALFDMDAHSVPAAGGVGADASGAAGDDPPAAAVELGPRAEAAEHAEVVDQEERDLDGRMEVGWMDGWMDRWMDVVGVNRYAVSLPDPRRQPARPRPIHPPIHLCIHLSIATLSKPFSMPPASSTSAPPASAASEARPITCRRPRELREWRGGGVGRRGW